MFDVNSASGKMGRLLRPSVPFSLFKHTPFSPP